MQELKIIPFEKDLKSERVGESWGGGRGGERITRRLKELQDTGQLEKYRTISS